MKKKAIYKKKHLAYMTYILYYKYGNYDCYFEHVSNKSRTIIDIGLHKNLKAIV